MVVILLVCFTYAVQQCVSPRGKCMYEHDRSEERQWRFLEWEDEDPESLQHQAQQGIEDDVFCCKGCCEQRSVRAHIRCWPRHSCKFHPIDNSVGVSSVPFVIFFIWCYLLEFSISGCKNLQVIWTSFRRNYADPNEVAGVILGGGTGTQLFPLTSTRANPVVRWHTL
jgi:hypothetical protein